MTEEDYEKVNKKVNLIMDFVEEVYDKKLTRIRFMSKLRDFLEEYEGEL